MTHEEAFALLDAFLDEELDPVTGAGIEHHLQGCRVCAEFLETRRDLRRILHSPQMRFRVPPELSRRLMKPATPDVGWLRAAGLAAVFLISGFLAGQYRSQSAELVLANSAGFLPRLTDNGAARLLTLSASLPAIIATGRHRPAVAAAETSHRGIQSATRTLWIRCSWPARPAPWVSRS